MANILLGFPNRIDSATLSGGNWPAPLGLVNLQDRVLSHVARSANLDLASTTFLIDLGTVRSIRILALIAHNISLGGRIRYQASVNADLSSPVLDTTVDAWGVLVNAEWNLDELEWENDNFWLGSYTLEDIEGQTAISAQVFDHSVSARYWQVSISDAGNTDGVVDIGRVFIGDGFLQPKVNYSYGGSLAYEDSTGVDTSLSGAEFFDIREPVRVMRFQLASLTEDEAFSRALELVRRAGTHGEIFVVADPDDMQFNSQRNFMGRMRVLNALEQAAFETHSMAFEIKELR